MPERRVILLADRWYATTSFVRTCRELGVGALIRLKRNRKLYRAARRTLQTWPLFHSTRPETYGGSRENMAITFSSKTCSGPRRTCARLSRSNGGVGSWHVLAVSC